MLCREPKLHCSRQVLGESAESSRITSVQCNCNGSKISILSNSVSTLSSRVCGVYCLPPTHTHTHTQAGSQLHQLTLWDVDTDTVKIFNPAALLGHTHPPGNHTPQYTTLPPELPEPTIKEQHSQLKALINYDIVDSHWDSNEPRLLVLVTRGKASEGNKKGKHIQVREVYGCTLNV